MNLKEQIEKYTPIDEQEEKDKNQFLKFVIVFNHIMKIREIKGKGTSFAKKNLNFQRNYSIK